ncbi:MAG: ABC transporter substrate-binding protein [Betaproteobacteria bacterium]
MMLRLTLLLLVLLLDTGLREAQAAEPVHIGFDGSYGVKTSTADQAIEWGVRAAMEEINAAGGVLGGRPLRLLTRDNQALPARAKDNVAELALVPGIIGVLGGKYSPAVLESFSQPGLNVPLISVWGSADGITDNAQPGSYIFRLSLKDSWGVKALLDRAVRRYKAQRVCAVLPNTAWGRSSDAVLKAPQKNGATVVFTGWYNLGDSSFSPMLASCQASGGQALVLVANEKEAATVFHDMAQLPAAQRLPLLGHWGMAGGVLHELAADALDKVEHQVIQTFTFIDNKRPAAQRLGRWIMKAGGFSTVAQIPSPVGAAQAYDMTHLLALAVNKAGTTEGAKIRKALENLPSYQGAVRTYAPAFSAKNHEALGPEQALFVKFERSGALTPQK